MTEKSIVLCGFMGSGKSTVGKLLAEKLGCTFTDMDTYIENKANMTVSEIFSAFGEETFRKMETEAAEELAHKPGQVIAAGGGTLLSPKNVSIFKGNSIIVLLDAPLAVIRERLKEDTTRPLLNRPDRDEAIQKLYDSRMPLYRSAADVTVFAGNSPLMVVEELLKKI